MEIFSTFSLCLLSINEETALSWSSSQRLKWSFRDNSHPVIPQLEILKSVPLVFRIKFIQTPSPNILKALLSGSSPTFQPHFLPRFQRQSVLQLFWTISYSELNMNFHIHHSFCSEGLTSFIWLCLDSCSEMLPSVPSFPIAPGAPYKLNSALLDSPRASLQGLLYHTIIVGLLASLPH